MFLITILNLLTKNQKLHDKGKDNQDAKFLKKNVISVDNLRKAKGRFPWKMLHLSPTFISQRRGAILLALMQFKAQLGESVMALTEKVKGDCTGVIERWCLLCNHASTSKN